MGLAELNRRIMHKHLRTSLQSFVAFPVLAASLVISPLTGLVAGSPSVAAISPDTNRTLSSETAVNQQSAAAAEAQADLDTKAAKIDAYFAQYNLPLAGEGHKLAQAAEANDLPWPLLAAVAMRESTGGAHEYNGYNAFGYGSAKFSSYDQAIDTVAATLGANSPKTASFYAKETIPERLTTYNGNAVAGYADSVQGIMNKIEAMPTSSSDA